MKQTQTIKDFEEGDEEDASRYEKIDLTLEQTKSQEVEGVDELDDIDLLDATIDPTDIKTLQKVAKLKAELRHEEIKIKAKIIYRAAMSPENPLKIDQ